MYFISKLTLKIFSRQTYAFCIIMIMYMYKMYNTCNTCITKTFSFLGVKVVTNILRKQK